MNCGDVRGELAARLCGELPPDTERSFDAHLATCSTCREQYAALTAVRDALPPLPGPPVRVDLGRLYADAALADQSRLRHWRRAALAVGAAAALLLIALTVRLEVRFEQHQLTVRWNAPPPVAEMPPPAPVAAIAPPGPSEESLRTLHELVRALADDVESRDREQQLRLVHVLTQLRQVRRESDQWRLTAERDLTALYNVHFGGERKENPP